MSYRIIWIFGDRLIKVVDRFPQNRRRSFVPEKTALEIKLVSFWIVGGFGSQVLFCRASQLGIQLIGDGSRDFTFHAENIVKLAVITFGPDMLVRRSFD